MSWGRVVEPGRITGTGPGSGDSKKNYKPRPDPTPVYGKNRLPAPAPVKWKEGETGAEDWKKLGRKNSLTARSQEPEGRVMKYFTIMSVSYKNTFYVCPFPMPAAGLPLFLRSYRCKYSVDASIWGWATRQGVCDCACIPTRFVMANTICHCSKFVPYKTCISCTCLWARFNFLDPKNVNALASGSQLYPSYVFSQNIAWISTIGIYPLS